MSASTRPAALPFSLAIGLGALLLFQLELVLGKLLLPYFGGAPAVWTTCMLFYQLLLLGGYAYAHALARRLPAGAQRTIHCALLAAAAILLGLRAEAWPSPITPPESWKPEPGGDPVTGILGFLTGAIGLPFLLLSTTAPLLQHWYARVLPAASPYRLYALSNLGSLVGLLSYPFVVEPALDLPTQGRLWAVTFVPYLGAVAWAAVAAGRAPVKRPSEEVRSGPSTARATSVLWFLTSMTGSVLLLAVTAQLCQEVAVIPMLWILPLALYLISFVLCFEYPRACARRFWLPPFVLVVVGAAALLIAGPGAPVWLWVPGWSLLLLVVCVVLHGELERSKPAPERLTGFYLLISAGGAAGGAFSSLVAPTLFSGFWELHLAVAAACVLVLIALHRDRSSGLWQGGRFRHGLWRLGWAGFVAVVVTMSLQIGIVHRNSILVARSFFGVFRVDRAQDGEAPGTYLSLKHGRITHGYQYEDPERARIPTSYYGPKSGIGLALRLHPARDQRPMRVGVIGLGTGSVAVYVQPGDQFRFYEIDPEIVAISHGEKALFSYLNGAPSPVEVVLGDARLALEREPDQRFDVLAVDAFSSDAIPAHLLTVEAVGVYLRHLRPDGILAIHVSNRFLDLPPLVRGLAAAHDLAIAQIEDWGDPDKVLWYNDWMLLSRDRDVLRHWEIEANATVVEEEGGWPVWTDAFGDLLSVMR